MYPVPNVFDAAADIVAARGVVLAARDDCVVRPALRADNAGAVAVRPDADAAVRAVVWAVRADNADCTVRTDCAVRPDVFTVRALRVATPVVPRVAVVPSVPVRAADAVVAAAVCRVTLSVLRTAALAKPMSAHIRPAKSKNFLIFTYL